MAGVKPKKDEVKTEEVKESKENQVEQKPMTITHEDFVDDKPFETTKSAINAMFEERELKQSENSFSLALKCKKIIPHKVKTFEDKKTGETKPYDSYQAEFDGAGVGIVTLSLSETQHEFLQTETWYRLTGRLIGKGDMNNLALDRVKDCSLEKINF